MLVTEKGFEYMFPFAKSTEPDGKNSFLTRGSVLATDTYAVINIQCILSFQTVIE